MRRIPWGRPEGYTVDQRLHIEIVRPGGSWTARGGFRPGEERTRCTEIALLAQLTLPRAHACLIAFLFASTCMHCDCVEVDTCLNLVCSIVCGDVRCPGVCLAVVLCVALLALFVLLSLLALHCICAILLAPGSPGAYFNPGEQPGETHNFEIHF